MPTLKGKKRARNDGLETEIAVRLINATSADRAISGDREKYERAVRSLECVAVAARDWAFDMRRYSLDPARRELSADELGRHPLRRVFANFHSMSTAEVPNQNGDGSWTGRMAGEGISATLYELLAGEPPSEQISQGLAGPLGGARISSSLASVLDRAIQRCRTTVSERLRSSESRFRADYVRTTSLAEEWAAAAIHPWSGMKQQLLNLFDLPDLPSDPIPPGAGPREIERIGLAFSSVALAFEAESFAIPSDDDLRKQRRGASGNLPRRIAWRDLGKWMSRARVSARRVARHPLAMELLRPEVPPEERTHEDRLKKLENLIAQRTGT